MQDLERIASAKIEDLLVLYFQKNRPKIKKTRMWGVQVSANWHTTCYINISPKYALLTLVVVKIVFHTVSSYSKLREPVFSVM